ncbi:MAG: hypothetical protein ACYC3E_00570 [Carboxydocellales bacterium]
MTKSSTYTEYACGFVIAGFALYGFFNSLLLRLLKTLRNEVRRVTVC